MLATEGADGFHLIENDLRVRVGARTGQASALLAMSPVVNEPLLVDVEPENATAIDPEQFRRQRQIHDHGNVGHLPARNAQVHAQRCLAASGDAGHHSVCVFWILAQVSRRPTVRLKTNASGVLSGSTQK